MLDCRLLLMPQYLFIFRQFMCSIKIGTGTILIQFCEKFLAYNDRVFVISDLEADLLPHLWAKFFPDNDNVFFVYFKDARAASDPAHKMLWSKLTHIALFVLLTFSVFAGCLEISI